MRCITFPPDSRVRLYVLPARCAMHVLQGHGKIIGLPDDARIHDVRDAGPELQGMLIMVHSASFDEVAEGNLIPRAHLEYEAIAKPEAL